MSNGEVLIKLSRAQALVLFEWLATLESQPPPFKHPAEEHVLWKIAGQLESILVEPFERNYDELLSQAREAVESGQ
jgi:hypothetical protein